MATVRAFNMLEYFLDIYIAFSHHYRVQCLHVCVQKRYALYI